MGAFRLSKWYMDCVAEDGEVVIAYAARLTWHAFTLHYASILTRKTADGEARTQTSVRATDEPTIADGALAWKSGPLDFSGRWSELGDAIERKIFESRDGDVTWRCVSPRARAEITIGDRVVRGRGYVEHLELTIEPWIMPIDELRWGRFVGEKSSLVWIDWRGAHEKKIALLDGEELGAFTVDPRAFDSERVKLAIEEGGALRAGAIKNTALAQIPGIERFPLRILAVDERKWCARATLESARGTDRGFAIHEIVQWPPWKPKRASDGALGKVLYGALFAIVIPALLVAWARATERVVHAPAIHAPRAGLALAIAGALTMIAGWFGLWRDGGGLPMNAFPPPRLATRGAYALFAHPIYLGFTAICFGASVAFGSASGLWLVSPAVALGTIAIVLGYERHDLAQRFGDRRPAPWIDVPPGGVARPTFARRVSALVFVIATCLLPSVATLTTHNAPAALFAASAPFGARSKSDVRAIVVRVLLGFAMLAPLPWLSSWFPAPSFVAFGALVAADAWTAHVRAPFRWLARAAAIALAALDDRRDGIAAAAIAYALAASVPSIWRWMRGLAERIANSWHETRFGAVRVINYGLWGGLAAGGGVFIIGTGTGPGHFAGVMAASLGGLVGAGLWAQKIEGSAALSRPYGFYGGLLGICLAGICAPLLGTPTWLLLGSVALSAPYIQAMGRVRCLVQGCCHGSPTSDAIGIRYHHPRSRVCRIAHLDDVPIHPTPLYSILWNVVTMIVIGRLWSLHAALNVIGGVYFVLNGLGRFCEEAYRGEPQTPIYARLRLYQWVAIAQVVAGALITALGEAPNAPPLAPNVGALVAGVVSGLLYWFALGVDFPESKRRLSRLA